MYVLKGSLAKLSLSRLVLKVGDQASFCPCALREVSILTELALGHLRCCLADMPPQPNSLSQSGFQTTDHAAHQGWRLVLEKGGWPLRFRGEAAAARMRPEGRITPCTVPLDLQSNDRRSGFSEPVFTSHL